MSELKFNKTISFSLGMAYTVFIYKSDNQGSIFYTDKETGQEQRQNINTMFIVCIISNHCEGDENYVYFHYNILFDPVFHTVHSLYNTSKINKYYLCIIIYGSIRG